ncbi:MAG: flagellar hook-associated protein FlgK [Deltaproteobacteria bacterium]|nr:flagellar hook-associated protein FlgK [Deltaproteobacteria bacterium]
MAGIDTVLNTGKWALFAAQSQISVTGNNIANVNTPGYRRQTVILQEGMSLDGRPGQIGTGVVAKEVIRHFDAFIEAQYNDKAADREKWAKLRDSLSNVEMLVNEANGQGLSEAMELFWQDWQDLAARPDDGNTRAALLGHAQNLLGTLSLMDGQMDTLRGQMNDFIRQDVDEVNALLKEIAGLNSQISLHLEEGKNNPNSLYDERDQKIRLLAEKMDVKTIEKDMGQVMVLTRAGHTLVDGPEFFSLSFEQGKTQTYLTGASSFSGSIEYAGESGHEITVEVVDPGAVGTATFRVSVDGGSSWLKDEDGNDLHFSAEEYAGRASILNGQIQIWFEPGGALAAGDRFELIPKKALYWHQTTASAVNITPRILEDGTEDPRRLTGGSLAGFFQFRDTYVGRYQEKLDEFARSLAWEVNRIHSQGAGQTGFTSVSGTYGVTNSTLPLDSANAGLLFGDRLQAGNLNIFVYDANGNLVSPDAGIDFVVGGGNFDPTSMSLDDAASAVSARDHLTASISGGKLLIEAESGYSFVFGTDSTGLLAALGLNTFFSGGNAGDLALNPMVQGSIAHINSGHVNGAGEFNPGDNTTARAIAELQHKNVSINTIYEGTTSQTLQQYYNSLVGNIGADTSMAKYNFQYQSALAQDLNSRQEEISGVNLDEEMSNLIRFQHSYTAAAKLITTADQMFKTLLGLKN